jgi:hypothetical protein
LEGDVVRFRPQRISIRPAGGGVWRTLGVLKAAEDMHLQDTMPDDTMRILDLARNWTASVTFTGVSADTVRILFNIPAGFPLWYRTPRKALPAPPTRAALPWGDSCYTTAVFAQVDGWPRMMWGMGPVTDQTPSSEGPRGEPRGDAYMIRRLGRRRG